MDRRVQTRQSTGAIAERRVWNLSTRKRQKNETTEPDNEESTICTEVKAKDGVCVKKFVAAKQSPQLKKEKIIDGVKKHGTSSKKTLRTRETPGTFRKEETMKTKHESSFTVNKDTSKSEIKNCFYQRVGDSHPSLSLEMLTKSTSGKQVKLVIPTGQESKAVGNWMQEFLCNTDRLFSFSGYDVKVIDGEVLDLTDGKKAIIVPQFEQENDIILIAVSKRSKDTKCQENSAQFQTQEHEASMQTLSEENQTKMLDLYRDSDKPDQEEMKTTVNSGSIKLEEPLHVNIKESQECCETTKSSEMQTDGSISDEVKAESQSTSVNVQDTESKLDMTVPSASTTDSPSTRDQGIQNDIDEELPDSEYSSPEKDMSHQYIQAKLEEMGRETIAMNGPQTKYSTRTSQNKAKARKTERDFKCRYCDKAFMFNKDLVSHVRTHTGEKPFVCEICSKGFTQKGVLKSHMRTHTGEKPFVCHLCARAFGDATSLKVHIRFHTGERPYKCQLCDRKYHHKSALNNHMLRHTGEKKFMCHVCGITFATSDRLKSHMRSHSGEKQQYPCALCDRPFHSKRNRLRHMAVHTGKKVYMMCDVCGKTIISRTNFKKHMLIHKTDKPFTCDTCDQKFRDKKSFNKHVAAHADQPCFVCQVCEKQFLQMTKFKRHMVTHKENANELSKDSTDANLYACNYCDKRYKSKQSFKKHHLSHPEAQNIVFRCSECGRLCATPEILQEHFATHDHTTTERERENELYLTTEESAEGVYSCGTCAESFVTPQLLDDHLKIHDNLSERQHNSSVNTLFIQQEGDDKMLYEYVGQVEDGSQAQSDKQSVEAEIAHILEQVEQSGPLNQNVTENTLEDLEHAQEVTHLEYVIREDGQEKTIIMHIR